MTEDWMREFWVWLAWMVVFGVIIAAGLWVLMVKV